MIANRVLSNRSMPNDISANINSQCFLVGYLINRFRHKSIGSWSGLCHLCQTHICFIHLFHEAYFISCFVGSVGGAGVASLRKRNSMYLLQLCLHLLESILVRFNVRCLQNQGWTCSACFKWTLLLINASHVMKPLPKQSGNAYGFYHHLRILTD